MTTSGKAASVHDRLLAAARANGSDFNLLLSRYALERFLYRISASRYKDRFLLKGALLFCLWYDTPSRPTRDADLLGFDALEAEAMAAVFREICAIECDDGMHYRGDSIRATEIREDARYGGIRIELKGMLGNARCDVQIDVGFGDAVTPEPTEVEFPLLLPDNPAPIIKAYPKETVIAEKLEAIVTLGMANSRMKDYFDLYTLLGESGLRLDLTARAIQKTFERRKTPLPQAMPLGLGEEFASAKGKITQWKAFLAKNKLTAPPLDHVVALIRERFREIMSD
jgi:predicted nucleotidyltransferase component of viral defense system